MIIEIIAENEKLSFYDFQDYGLFKHGSRPLIGDTIVSNHGKEYIVKECRWDKKINGWPILTMKLEFTGNTFTATVYQQLRNFLKTKEDNKYKFNIDNEEYSITIYPDRYNEEYINIHTKKTSFVAGCADSSCEEIENKIIEYLKENNIIK